MDGPSSSNGRRTANAPYIKIVEQPASKALRFRYECEGRSAGSIPGVNSTTENKTYPTIQIVGYKGRAVVVVSCVTKDRPFRPHPHNLVGRDNCKRGICTIEINNESMTASFQNLGIQCVKRKDIDEHLKIREDIRVDPFRTGFSHKDNPSSIDLNAVRLCFQAFLGGSQKGKYSILEPVVSDPIYDKKAMSDLVICRLSDAAASVAGGREIILLCEKVTKDDIQVRFYEEQDGLCTWEGYADFQPSDVHKQVAISFRTPKYKTLQVDYPVKVWIQLKRPTDGMCSDARPFLLTPVDSDPAMLKRKRQKLPCESDLLRQLQSDPRLLTSSSNFIEGMVIDPISIAVPIKEEPETSPNPYSSLYPLSNTNVLGQPSPLYNSRTPSPLEYQFPNTVTSSNNFYGQITLSKVTVRPPQGIQTNCGTISGCTVTEVCPTLNNQTTNCTPSQSSCSLPTAITITPLPCPTEGNNDSTLMETTFSSLDRLDSNDLRAFTMIEDSEQVLSANLSASLQLADGNLSTKADEVVHETMNMSDSFDRIANSTLNEFCEIYTKHN
ncbi:embryonic polarity protein dorsal-like isoform X2 [Adelges cooleyi]|nr:embryonic polarity protein dorsal-like isoform X2 [Adelges cooleyi]XP_050440904.1 embryonic polarity protein dorsal-like isoform X2 [Adelges cooleyi]XP_050440905.1 embryonic polarity protein dorsal-like isoform X2 [Adelges cooleyi]